MDFMRHPGHSFTAGSSSIKGPQWARVTLHSRRPSTFPPSLPSYLLWPSASAFFPTRQNPLMCFSLPSSKCDTWGMQWEGACLVHVYWRCARQGPGRRPQEHRSLGVLKSSLEGQHEGPSEDRGAGEGAPWEEMPSPTGNQKDLKVARVPVRRRNFCKGIHALLLCLSFWGFWGIYFQRLRADGGGERCHHE